MATQETKILDDIIASRRQLLMGGGAALAALAIPAVAQAASTVTTYTDADILNFALNLEYLEANFYYLAAFGTNISTANSLYPAGAGIQGITGVGTQGTVVTKPTNCRVPFANANIAAYCVETAIEEGNHVAFLRSALGTAAVAQPQIDLYGAFNTLYNAAAGTTGATFDPFSSDAFFLIGAYIFEDVGVTAYHGAASLITSKSNLGAAAGILAVEAYHAGLVRTTINALDPMNTNGYLTLTQLVSALRAKLAGPAPGGVGVTTPSATSYESYPDDIALYPGTTMVSLAGAAAVPATNIVNANVGTTTAPGTVIAFTRTTTQVLNIVTGGGAATAGTKATGVFFPNGLNGLFS